MLSQPLRAQPACSIAGPDSIHFDKVAWNSYLPPDFTVHVTVANTGGRRIDSVTVFARSSTQFTILPPPAVLLADTMSPGDTLRTEFSLVVQPRRESGLDTIHVTISAKGGMRSECMLVLWVEKEYRPANALICPPDDDLRISYADTLNAYDPDPVVFPLRLINGGDAPSKDSRILYVATPALSVAEGQDPVLELGTLGPGASAAREFRLRPVPRDNDTTVLVRFKAQGRGGLGDPMIDTLCSSEITIPARREAKLGIVCDNDVRISYENGVYVPNPFLWTAQVGNVGPGYAKDVRAVISLPPNFRLDSSESETKFLGNLNSGDRATVSWLIHALPVAEPYTGIICVRASDAFKHTAVCCDSAQLPPVTASDLHISCVLVPDSMGIDPRTGLYQPAEAIAQLNISNAGSEGVDSVWAEIVVSDPDTELGAPADPVRLVADRLPPGGFVQTAWRIAPRPVPQERDITLLFRVRASRGAERTTTCRLSVAAALQPALSCGVETAPLDTLHFNAGTLEYDPVSVTAVARNDGGAAAYGVQAAILLPAGIGLADGESPLKAYGASPLAPGGEWRVTWRLAPAARRAGPLDTLRVEFKSASISAVCDDWIFIIGIPPVTVLNIPTNNLAQHGHELRAPIIIDNTDNKFINRLETTVTYDRTILEFLDFDRQGSMLERWSFQPFLSPGRAGFTAIGDTTVLSGEGTLLHMRFRVVFGLGDEALKARITPLVFDTLVSSINRGGIKTRYLDGAAVVSGDCLPPLTASERFVLLTVSPNPGREGNRIRVTVPRAAELSLRVFDMLGRPVLTLAEGASVSGDTDFTIPAGRLAPGLYICRAEAGEHNSTVKFSIR